MKPKVSGSVTLSLSCRHMKVRTAIARNSSVRAVGLVGLWVIPMKDEIPLSQAAARAGIHYSVALRLAIGGTFGAVHQVNGRWCIPVAGVEAFIAGRDRNPLRHSYGIASNSRQGR